MSDRDVGVKLPHVGCPSFCLVMSDNDITAMTIKYKKIKTDSNL